MDQVYCLYRVSTTQQLCVGDIPTFVTDMAAGKLLQCWRKRVSENRRGRLFHYSTITSILQREQLTGILCSGSSRSKVIPELQIISPVIFAKAREINVMRNHHELPAKITAT